MPIYQLFTVIFDVEIHTGWSNTFCFPENLPLLFHPWFIHRLSILWEPLMAKFGFKYSNTETGHYCACDLQTIRVDLSRAVPVHNLTYLRCCVVRCTVAVSHRLSANSPKRIRNTKYHDNECAHHAGVGSMRVSFVSLLAIWPTRRKLKILFGLVLIVWNSSDRCVYWNGTSKRIESHLFTCHPTHCNWWVDFPTRKV